MTCNDITEVIVDNLVASVAAEGVAYAAHAEAIEEVAIVTCNDITEVIVDDLVASVAAEGVAYAEVSNN